MKKLIIFLISTCFIVSGILLFFYFKNNKTSKEQIKNIIQEQNINNADTETLDIINEYQKKYFDIIKRNDVLVTVADDEEIKKDSIELQALFSEVKSKIAKNNEYLKEYENIENKFKENPGDTTVEMDMFAEKNYVAVDKLLNDTYKAVKNQINQEEFEKLKLSQRAWLKEVEDYNNVFEAQGFGTIGGVIKAGYEINMREFRTLLLMLYLNNSDTLKLKDFLGQWSEVSAGRIYVNIEDKKDKVQVTYGGANSAYSHSETIYDCKFDNNSSNLICDSAKHTDQFLSCKGISSEDDMEGFLNCIEKYPDTEKDDYKTYFDNKVRTLKIKKGSKNHFIIDEEEHLSNEKKAEIRSNFENLGLFFEDDAETVFYKYKG